MHLHCPSTCAKRHNQSQRLSEELSHRSRRTDEGEQRIVVARLGVPQGFELRKCALERACSHEQLVRQVWHASELEQFPRAALHLLGRRSIQG